MRIMLERVQDIARMDTEEAIKSLNDFIRELTADIIKINMRTPLTITDDAKLHA